MDASCVDECNEIVWQMRGDKVGGDGIRDVLGRVEDDKKSTFHEEEYEGRGDGVGAGTRRPCGRAGRRVK